MSWTAAPPPVDEPSEIGSAAAAALDLPNLSDEAIEQFKAAVTAATALAPLTGAGPYQVVLSGHANPGHRPASGWSNDSITITVNSRAAAPEAPSGPSDSASAGDNPQPSAAEIPG